MVILKNISIAYYQFLNGTEAVLFMYFINVPIKDVLCLRRNQLFFNLSECSKRERSVRAIEPDTSYDVSIWIEDELLIEY